MSRYDLHSHSRCSDGVLSPAEVVARARARGVEVLALTDHDDVAGLAEARAAALDTGITLIDGAELSVTWERQSVHVVGLNIDPMAHALVQGLAGVRAGRACRARRIADSLAEAGIRGAYEGAMKHVANGCLVSRTHFARHLVAAGHAADVGAVFRRFLTPGKPGYVSHAWPSLGDALSWIHAAGGQAVLAHPGRYKLAPSARRRLLGEFRDSGGSAIEIASPAHTAEQAAEYATLARVFGLAGSCGSDFHAAHERAVDLGDFASLPAGVVPVWRAW